MEVPQYVTCHFFPLVALIFSLSLTFVSLITVCLGVLLFGGILPGTLCASWTWLTVSFPMLGKISAIMSSNIIFGPFSLFSFWDSPYNANVHALTLSQKSLRLSSFFFPPIFCSVAVIYIILFSRSFMHSSASVVLLLIPSSVLLISVCLFFMLLGLW